MSAGDVMGSAEIAKAFGCSIWTARRWLLEMERKHGSTVVGRRGRALFTTRLAFEQIAPRALGERKQIAELQQRAADAEKRADKMASDLSSVKKDLTKLQHTFFAWMKDVPTKRKMGHE